jgi:FkbM family methyltransferase
MPLIVHQNKRNVQLGDARQRGRCISLEQMETSPDQVAQADEPAEKRSAVRRARAAARASLSRYLLTPVFSRVTYTIRRGPAAGLKRRGGLDFLPEWARPSNAEDALMATILLEGGVAYDVGAWEGITTLALARRVGASGQVVAFEPNPAAARRLYHNLRLNPEQEPRIRLLETAVSDSQGNVLFASRKNATGRAHFVRPEEAGHPSGRDQIISVAADTIDHLLETAELPPPTFMKIDVEGAETAVLRGAQGTIALHRPVLLLELHGSTPSEKHRNRSDILAALSALDYDGVHVETNKPLHSSPATGHLHCWPKGSPPAR